MSDPIQCDLSELISRGIYTDEDAIAHIKSANDYVVKSALDVPAITQLFANPVLAPLAERHGFISFSPGGPNNLYKKLLYEQQLQDRLRAAQMAAQTDRGTYMDTIRGLAAITGQEWTPERAAAAEQLSGQIANVSPMLMQLNPGLFERLHGRRGSAALMASRMMDTAQQFGSNPEHAAAVSAIVTRNLAQDPTWASGLSAGEVGNLYKQMYMRGMIPADDPFAAAGALSNMSAPAAVLKELGGSGSLEELEAMAPGMLSQLPPRELAFRLREQNILSQAPNLYGASGGKHRNLMAGAANSRMANQIGATLRLGSVAGFDVNPEEVADMNTSQWINYMKRRGIEPAQARAALSATPANQEFIYRRNVAPLVYSKQREELGGNLSRYFGKDVGSAIMDMPRDVMLDGRKRNQALSRALGVSPIEAETLWGRANTMMSRRYGMNAWDVNNLYNTGTMDLSRRFREDAANRANLESYYAGYLPSSPTQAFFESLQTAGPNTGLGEIAARTSGMVPIKEIEPVPPMPNIFGKQSELSDLLKDVTDTVALVSVQKETEDKRKAEQEENRQLLKAVERNKRERKARRMAASQDKVDVMLGKTSEHNGWRIGKSDIAGKGLFSTADFNPEDMITKAIDIIEKSEKYPWQPEYQQTDACRYTNHARKPNAKLVRDGDALNIVALEKIPNGVEITVNYTQANQEMGSGFYYTHNGEEYKTDPGIVDVVNRDMLLDLVEKLSNDKKKRKKKKQHT